MGAKNKRAAGVPLIPIRAAANRWLSDNFHGERRYLASGTPEYDSEAHLWSVAVVAEPFGGEQIGELKIDDSLAVVGSADIPGIVRRLDDLQQGAGAPKVATPDGAAKFGLLYGDGVAAGGRLPDLSIDMLLTDPPYGISDPYACEQQIPKRLRKNGGDFIMPRGEFGEWDHGFSPEAWTGILLPKIRGWCVIFCAQAQIGQYSAILEKHKFNAIGTLVWHKTNPVPFNHRFKLLNSWEAAVVGKRPGTKFNGKSVHNVFTYKSPSPQHRIHPTQKPLALIERLIELFTDEGDTILDPFAGSATTVLGAMRTYRRCVAFENNAEYYQAASARLDRLMPSGPE